MMNCATEHNLPIQLQSRRGIATVELAMVAPLLLALMFGIVEFGLLFKDVVLLNSCARSGARTAAVGATTTTIQATALNSATAMAAENVVITQEYGLHDEQTQTWDWTALADCEGENDAPLGAQVRITVSYPHTLIVGGMLPGLADEQGGATVTLAATSIMRRE